jgi:hypothetical protein
MESSIRDAAFTGSPLLSYGEAPNRRRLPKLLALLAGSFAVVAVVLVVWFWYFTALPMPTDASLVVIVPDGVDLPVRSPEVWRRVAKENSPLPTVMGFISDPSGSPKSTAFAIRVFSLTDFFADKGLSVWKMEADQTSGLIAQTAPQKIFGDLWALPHAPMLTIWPKRLFGSSLPSDLPEVLSGPVMGNIWQVPIDHDAISDQLTPLGPNNVILSASADDYLAKSTQINGLQIQLPASGRLNWVRHETSLDFAIQPNFPLSSSTLSGLESTQGHLGKKDALLPDQSAYQILRPLVIPDLVDEKDALISEIQTASSSKDLLKQQVYEFSLTDQVSLLLGQGTENVSQLTCPGNHLAEFDETSLKNICSWLDICFVDMNLLVIAEQGSFVNFCVK